MDDKVPVVVVTLENLAGGAALEGSMPQCALFEADGGAWKLAAIEMIRDFLVQGLGADSVGVVS